VGVSDVLSAVLFSVSLARGADSLVDDSLVLLGSGAVLDSEPGASAAEGFGESVDDSGVSADWGLSDFSDFGALDCDVGCDSVAGVRAAVVVGSDSAVLLGSAGALGVAVSTLVTGGATAVFGAGVFAAGSSAAGVAGAAGATGAWGA
jgi:hypothetical protein